VRRRRPLAARRCAAAPLPPRSFDKSAISQTVNSFSAGRRQGGPSTYSDTTAGVNANNEVSRGRPVLFPGRVNGRRGSLARRLPAPSQASPERPSPGAAFDSRTWPIPRGRFFAHGRPARQRPYRFYDMRVTPGDTRPGFGGWRPCSAVRTWMFPAQATRPVRARLYWTLDHASALFQLRHCAGV